MIGAYNTFTTHEKRFSLFRPPCLVSIPEVLLLLSSALSCTSIRIYIRIHMCIYIYTDVCTFICKYTCTCIYVYTYIYTYMYVYTY